MIILEVLTVDILVETNKYQSPSRRSLVWEFAYIYLPLFYLDTLGLTHSFFFENQHCAKYSRVVAVCISYRTRKSMKVVSHRNHLINDQYKGYRQELCNYDSATVRVNSVVLLSEVMDWASLPVHN